MKNIILLIGTAILLSCNTGNNKTQKAEPVIKLNELDVAKIYVFSNGVFTVNEKQASFEELDSTLQKLKSKNGTVYYSRENAMRTPPKEMTQVLDLIAKYSLPMKFFTDNTFRTPVQLK